MTGNYYLVNIEAPRTTPSDPLVVTIDHNEDDLGVRRLWYPTMEVR